MQRIGEWLNRTSRPNQFTSGMGKLIKQAREEKGMSQAELAEAVWRSRPAISEMESGKMEPDASTILYLAMKLEKPITYFFPEPYGPMYSPDAMSSIEQELIIHFRRLQTKVAQKVAIQQIKALADIEE